MVVKNDLLEKEHKCSTLAFVRLWLKLLLSIKNLTSGELKAKTFCISGLLQFDTDDLTTGF